MDKPRCILFTGISGTGVGGAIKKLRDFVAQSPLERRVRIVKAEKFFLPTARKMGLLDEHSRAGNKEDMMLTLLQPKQLLRDCWRTAFAAAIAEEPIDETNEDVFLHAHACFYHHQTRDFFTLLDAKSIPEGLRPDAVITLMDDVEHVHERLRGSGEMFDRASYDYDGLRGIASAYHNVSTLMHWRAAEFCAAEQVALQLGCDHLLLPVKHPLQTAANLVYSDTLPRIYISHPISEPRRQLADRKTADFDEFTRRLAGTCRSLRGGAVLFEPTAIDELRFRRFTVVVGGKKSSVFLPSLTRRWPMPGAPEDLLWTPPDEENANPIDELQQFTEEQFMRFREIAQGDPVTDKDDGLHKLQAASALTGALVGEIEDQIAARDLKLVEQSPILLVVRPLYKGNASGGVDAEMRFHLRLSEAQKFDRPRIWVFTTSEDERWYRINQAGDWLRSITPLREDSPGADRIRANIEELDLTAPVFDVVTELLKLARAEGMRPPEPEPSMLKGTAVTANIQQRKDFAAALEVSLQLPYMEILECGVSNVEVEVRPGNEWPDDAFLLKVLAGDTE